MSSWLHVSFLLSSHAFGSVVGRGDPAVHFRAARSFNREGPELIEATCKSSYLSDST